MNTAPVSVPVTFLTTVALALPATAQTDPGDPDVCGDTKLIAREAARYDYFGHSVSLSGETALIGAPSDNTYSGADPGAIHFFDRSAAGWVETDRLTAGGTEPNTQFGFAVSLYGGTAMAGAPRDRDGGYHAGAVHVFEREASGWVATAKLTAVLPRDGADFGWSVSLFGDRALVGSPGDDYVTGGALGSVRVFERTPSGWFETQKLSASDGEPGRLFGWSVSLSGDTAFVGAPHYTYGAVYVFELTPTGWVETQKLVNGAPDVNDFGSAVSLSGGEALVGAYSGYGTAHVYERRPTGWLWVSQLGVADRAPGDRFGWSLSLWGGYALVGAWQRSTYWRGPGKAYLFERTEFGWRQMLKLTAGDGEDFEQFGYSVSLSEGTVLVGAPHDDDEGPWSGSAYVYQIPAADFAASYCFGVGCPCGNDDAKAGCANSSGGGALLTACGSESVAADDLLLTASGLPTNKWGLFYMGAAQLDMPFGDGQRCVGSGGVGMFRFFPLQNSGPLGTLVLGPGIAAHASASFPGAGHIDPGDTWSFQTWYRDPAGPCRFGFNLSSAVAVTFAP